MQLCCIRWQARKENDRQMRAGLIPSRMLQEKRIAYERAHSANNNGDSLAGKSSLHRDRQTEPLALFSSIPLSFLLFFFLIFSLSHLLFFHLYYFNFCNKKQKRKKTVYFSQPMARKCRWNWSCYWSATKWLGVVSEFIDTCKLC